VREKERGRGEACRNVPYYIIMSVLREYIFIRREVPERERPATLPTHPRQRGEAAREVCRPATSEFIVCEGKMADERGAEEVQ